MNAFVTIRNILRWRLGTAALLLLLVLILSMLALFVSSRRLHADVAALQPAGHIAVAVGTVPEQIDAYTVLQHTQLDALEQQLRWHELFVALTIAVALFLLLLVLFLLVQMNTAPQPSPPYLSGGMWAPDSGEGRLATARAGPVAQASAARSFAMMSDAAQDGSIADDEQGQRMSPSADAGHEQAACPCFEQAMELLAMSQLLTADSSYADLATILHERSRALFQAEYGLLYLGRHDTAQGLSLVRPPAGLAMSDDLEHCTVALAERACREADVVSGHCQLQTTDYSCVASPLRHNGDILGACLVVQANRSHTSYSPTDWSMLTMLANVIATACANMQLVAELRRYADNLELQVRERTAELLRSRDLLRFVFDNLPEGLLLLDAEGKLLAANNAFCYGVVGRAPQSIVGWRYPRLWDDLAAQAVLYRQPQGVPIRLERGEHDVIERTRVLCTDGAGQQRWYVVERTAINGWGGSSERYLERWLDVTQQEELQRRLIIHEQLTSLGRLAASIVHEVGNPLQSVVGCLELCREDPALPERAAEYVGMAQDELERMGRTLERLRDLYRPPQYNWCLIDVQALLAEVQRLTVRQFRRQRVVLELHLADDFPPVYGQPDALRQVFLNLVLNAQEAMPNGGTIQIVSHYQPGQKQCQLDVRDTGIGISPDQLALIFEPFHSRKAQGVGLGLYLCRQIIEQHGGSISVESTPQLGTTFHVVLLTEAPAEIATEHSHA